MTIAGGRSSYTTSFTVDQSPDEVFAAINQVRGWWSAELEGGTDRLGDEFTFEVDGVHRSRQRITESVPGTRVVWHVVDATLGFTTDTAEWKGTDIVFDIDASGGRTEVRFTHVGLVPDHECFDSCSRAWDFYVGDSLHGLITTGVGRPIQPSAPLEEKAGRGRSDHAEAGAYHRRPPPDPLGRGAGRARDYQR